MAKLSRDKSNLILLQGAKKYKNLQKIYNFVVIILIAVLYILVLGGK